MGFLVAAADVTRLGSETNRLPISEGEASGSQASAPDPAGN